MTSDISKPPTPELDKLTAVQNEYFEPDAQAIARERNAIFQQLREHAAQR